jgi:predicted outer membrane protein
MQLLPNIKNRYNLTFTKNYFPEQQDSHKQRLNVLNHSINAKDKKGYPFCGIAKTLSEV